jgi:hypothetical protein
VGNRNDASGVLTVMQIGLLLLTIAGVASLRTSTSSYLPTIQARWEASDLVCIGNASPPRRTGVVQVIDGANRDQLSADVELERCLKGTTPSSRHIVLLGDSIASARDQSGVIGFAYAGPPPGFVHDGRNLLFLRKSSAPDEFLVTVPIFQTAIPLADVAPTYPPASSPEFVKVVLTRELESAMLQTTENDQGMNSVSGEALLSDIEYINLLLDYLGKSDGATELSRFSETVPTSIGQDIAVMLLDRGHRENEAAVISILLNPSVPYWKRGNAAMALGMHGSQAALDPLQWVLSEPATTDQQKQLRSEVQSSLRSLERRLSLGSQSP